MAEVDYGPDHPRNPLAQDGKRAFLEKAEDVKAALASGSLGEACDRLGHRKDTPGAKVARALLDKLSDEEQNKIKERVLEALENEEPFPFVCSVTVDELKNVGRVYAHEEDRAGRSVVVITETAPGDG